MSYYLFVLFGSVILFLIITPLYLKLKQTKHRALALTIKGMGTLVPIIFCLVGTILINSEPVEHISSIGLLPKSSYWILVGLIFCLLGDIIIGIHFVCGMGAFLLGHLCYITAYSKLAPFQLWSILLFVFLFFLTKSYFKPLLAKEFGKGKLPYIIYNAVIVAMVSIAALLPSSIGYMGIIPALGAFLFILSDFLLGRNILVKVTPLSDAVSLYIYYAGQLIIAMSVYLYPLFI